MVLPRKPGPQPPMRRRKPPRAPGRGLLERVRGVLAGLFGRRFRPDPARYRAYLSQQSVLRFDVGLGAFGTVPELRQRLLDLELQPRESGWTFYLPPTAALHRRFPFLTEIYPPRAGLKILKDFQPPADAIYAAHALAPDGRGRRRQEPLTPSPPALLRVANLLHVAGIGPRVHDLVHLRAGDVDLSAYVVDHIAWTVSEHSHYRTFMARLRPLTRNGLIATLTPKPDLAADFKPPDCNDNLRLDPETGEPAFVDFHAFVIPDEARLMTTFARDIMPHAGGDQRRLLYQAIPGLVPGLRDPEKRMAAIAQLLRKANLDLDGRVVFDIGCNTGLMMAGALAAGAIWCFGWDHSVVAQAAARILAALGASRFTVFGDVIRDDTDFAGMLPPPYRLQARSLLLCLDVDEAIGFPAGVGYLPWRYMVYEGPPGRGVGPAWRRLQQCGWLGRDGQLVAHTLLSDDGGQPRPLMLVRREMR
jgi:hypothetical protein